MLPEPVRGFEDDDGKTRTAILWRDAVELDTDFYRGAWRIYVDWKRFQCLPHGKGTMDERKCVLDIIHILDNEVSQWDAWEREREMAKRRR